MGHARLIGCAMPMVDVGRDPYDIAGTDLALVAAFLLDPSLSGRDDEQLTRRMGVPRRPGAGREGYEAAGAVRELVGREQWAHHRVTRKVLGAPMIAGVDAFGVMDDCANADITTWPRWRRL